MRFNRRRTLNHIAEQFSSTNENTGKVVTPIADSRDYCPPSQEREENEKKRKKKKNKRGETAPRNQGVAERKQTDNDGDRRSGGAEERRRERPREKRDGDERKEIRRNAYDRS